MQVRNLIVRTIAPVAIAAFIAAGCGGDNGVLGVGGIPDDSFCSVNGTGLKTKEFDNLVDGAKQQFKDSGRDFPKKGSTEYDQLRSQAVDFLVQQQITNDQADKLGLSVSDKDVDKAEKELKKQYFDGDDKKFKEELKRSNYTVERVRTDLENKELSNKLYKKITADVKVSDADAKKYFEDNQDQFVTKESREVAHILVKTKAAADKIYAQVRGGDEKVFARLAKAQSEDPGSKDSGGVLPGGVQRGQTVAEFDAMAFKLKTGETSAPVKTQFGYHVIQARGPIKAEKKQTFKEVKKQIEDQLKSQKESERFQDWQEDVTNDAKENVECRKDYVWSKTVDSEKAAAEAAKKAAEEEKKADKDEKDADAKGDDAKGDDAKGDEKAADEKDAGAAEGADADAGATEESDAKAADEK